MSVKVSYTAMVQSTQDGDSRYQVSRLEHCLQTATRAENDGADDETIVCALLHDIGDILAPANHSEVAAAMPRAMQRPSVCWQRSRYRSVHR